MKQIKETEAVESKALDLHRKEKQLKQQKQTVMDAKYEVGEEIRKLRANIKYSEKAVRVVQRLRRKMEDKQRYYEEKE